MRVGNLSTLYKYYHSGIGTRIREKVIGKIWPDRNGHIDLPKVFIPPQTLEPNRFSTLRSLERTTRENPNRVLFVTSDGNQTAGETLVRVKKLAYGLKQNIGIKEGDKVALMALPHEKELYESFFALQAIGAIPVLINFLNPPETVAFMFANTDSKILIVGRDYRLRNGAARLALGGLLENVVTIGSTDYSNLTSRGLNLRNLLTKTTSSLLFYKYDSLIYNSEISEDELNLHPNKYDGALQLFTSGTTNKPKVMTYTYDMVASTVENTVDRFGITEKDVWLLPVPFYHLAGLIIFLGALNYKNPLVLTEIPRLANPASVKSAQEKLVKNKVTLFPGVPRVIEPVLDLAIQKNQILPDLKMVFSGGSPMTPRLVDLISKLNEKRSKAGIEPINLINFYASTECGPISSTVKPITINTIDSLGVPFKHVEVKVSDDGMEELLVRVPVFPPEIPAYQMTEDRFFRTGDQVQIEPDSNLRYKDRISDRLNVHGEKISPLIIQREVEKVPGVKEVHIFGVVKPETGTDIVCAVVVPNKGHDLKPIDIKNYLLNNLTPSLKIFIPSVVFIEPNGIPDTLIRGPGKTPRKILSKVYGERSLAEYYNNDTKRYLKTTAAV